MIAIWNDHLVGTPLERALLVRRRSRIWRRAGIVLIHVPKTAGTSLSQALYGRFVGHVRAADVKRWAPRAVQSLPMLAVARNPWDRLVSAYRFARRGSGTGPNAGGVWRPEQYQGPQFETFERFVTEWLASRDPRQLDLVFQPQSQFVCARDGQILVDHVGRFENLEASYAWLREKRPDIAPLAQSNVSGERIDYRGFYTPALAELVGKIYADDARIFGYTFEG